MSIDYDAFKSLYDRDIPALQEHLTFKPNIVRERDLRGDTLLHFATHQGMKSEAEILLKYGAEVDPKNKESLTPLHLAADYEYKESDTTSLLIENGANVNARSKDGRTPLHFAVLWGRGNIVDILLANGADANSAANDGSTPLHIASANHFEDIIDSLVRNGADVNSIDGKGWRPLSIAMKKGRMDVIKMLIMHKSDVHILDPDGNSLLHLAVNHGYVDLIKELVGKGVRVDIRNNKDKTPLQIAAAKKRKNIGKLLLSLGAEVIPDTEQWLFGCKSHVQKLDVPKWNHFGHDITDATPDELAFYYRWLKSYEAGHVLDINNNIAYLQIYIDVIINEFQGNNNKDMLFDRLDKLAQAYSDFEQITNEILYLKYQCYLYYGDYDKAWNIRRHSLSVADILYLRSKCSLQTIDGWDVINLPTDVLYKLTSFGLTHKAEIADIATSILDDFHIAHGYNYVEHFCRQFNFLDLTLKDLSELGNYLNKESDLKYYTTTYEHEKHYCINYIDYKPFVLQMVTPYAIAGIHIPAIIRIAVLHALAGMLRDCENIVRKKHDLPNIGEGWISETELFYLLKNEFPDEMIIQHASPTWLGKQHLDIYLPKRNIACEYQGIQHHTPVDRFGGHAGLRDQQIRDERKRHLCEEHGCVLIYVSENYDFDELANRLRAEILGI